jgi:hypothetical protein
VNLAVQQTTQATRRISAILSEFAHGLDQPRVTLRELTGVLGERAFGFMMLVLGLPNVIVMAAIPGFSTVTGVPIILIAGQLMFGRPQPWLPTVIGDRSLASEDFRKFVDRAVPHLERAEGFLRPRLAWLTRGLAERLLGAHCAVMAIILSLPIPAGNLLPALAICLAALGLIEKDGGFVVASLLMGVVTFIFLAFLTVIVAALVGAFWYLYNQL